MNHRAELVNTVPKRMVPFQMFVPVYDDAYVKPWQISLGMALINKLGGKDCPEDWRRVEPNQWGRTPFVREARDTQRLKGMFAFTEYQIDWPERLVADYLVDARRLGAVSRNYTEVDMLEPLPDGGWCLKVRDKLEAGQTGTIHARQIVNTAGPWIDRVLGKAPKPAPQQVAPTKGAHIAVRLPDEYARLGFADFNRRGYPFYILPLRDFHFIGPTET